MNSNEGRLPDFLIIGAMKSGTTSLHDYLGLHPDIFTSKTKEIHYFTDDKYTTFDLTWYKMHFITDKKIVGTAPQNYTKRHNKYYQNIPERIANHLPNAKLIYILRDPIERYKSHILENYYTEPLHDVRYNIESKHYEKTGLYYYQLQAYLKYFDLSQIHVTTLEDLVRDKLGTLNNIFRFLGVMEIDDAHRFDFVSNDYRSKILPYRIKTSIPYRILSKIAPIATDKLALAPILKRYIIQKGKKKHLSASEIERLKAYYEADVNQLRQLTGLAFNYWCI